MGLPGSVWLADLEIDLDDSVRDELGGITGLISADVFTIAAGIGDRLPYQPDLHVPVRMQPAHTDDS